MLPNSPATRLSLVDAVVLRRAGFRVGKMVVEIPTAIQHVTLLCQRLGAFAWLQVSLSPSTVGEF